MKKDTSIQTLHLSKRSYNVLKKFNVTTIQDLLSIPIKNIKNFHGLGEKSIQEILSKIEILKDYNFDNIDTSEIDIENLNGNKYFLNKYGEKYQDIPIESLGISEKSINFLKKLNIGYYSELLSKTDEELELVKVSEEIIQREIESIRRKPNIEIAINEEKDIPIEYLGLSVRAKNCLKSVNIEYYSQFLKKTEEELMLIKNMGVTTLRELQRLKFLIFFYFSFPIIDTESKKSPKINISNQNITFITQIAKILDCNTEKLISNIINYYSLVPNIASMKEIDYITKNILFLLWKDKYGKEKWLKYIIKEISRNTYGIQEEILWENLPEFFKDRKIYKKTIEYLCETNIIKKLYDDRFIVIYKSIKEAAYNYLKENEAKIILNRIAGKTLEEIGETLNVTRERIRQIETRAFKNFYLEKFKEDFFLDIFLKYDVNREVFLSVLKEEETYNYLSLRYRDELNQVKSLRKPLQEILEDEDIPIIIRRNFEKFIYKNYITFDKERILFGRASFTDYLIKHFANEEVSYDDFKEIYYMFLNDLGYEEEENLKILDRGYENRIRNNMNILWKPGRKFRYFNILEYDFTELLETLNLNQYENEEYSSLKFFKMYPNLMELYDIHDEYELHNLLKKICSEDKYPKIKFNRMPTIEFGTVDREEQVKSFLSLLSPISKQDFIKEYEEFYGVDSKTFSANNYLLCIEKYYCNGIYNIKFKEYDDRNLIDIKEILTEELYTVQEVKEKLKKAFPDYKGELLNPILLKKLDYKISGGYIFKNDYSSASHYFFQFLQKNEIIRLDNISFRIKRLPMFLSQLSKLKEEYEIIEFLPNYFIKFSKLEKLGITKEYLKQYCLDILEFTGKNKYFTLFSLKKEGFYHELDELGFEDYFYTSILIEDRERISYKRIGKNKLMYSSNEGANFESFLEYIVYQEEKLYIEIYELNDLLKEKYNLQFNTNELISFIKNTSMYYDPVSKMVFADYEIYYEVI